ncbi:MAG: hypothetical protein V1866_07475 [archaeon]
MAKNKVKELKKEKKVGFWRSQRYSFLDSFRHIASKKFVVSAILDLLALIICAFMLSTGWMMINLVSSQAVPELMKMHELRITNQTEALNQASFDYGITYKNIMIHSMIIGVCTFVLFCMMVSIFYGGAWLISRDRKFSSLFLKKYFAFNILWFMLWFIIIAGSAALFIISAAKLIIFLEMIIFFFTDFAVRSAFDEKKKISASFGYFLKTIAKAWFFIIFIISSLLVWVILLSINGLFKSNDLVFMIVFVLFTTFFMGWARNYVNSLVDNIDRKI